MDVYRLTNAHFQLSLYAELFASLEPAVPLLKKSIWDVSMIQM